MIHSRQRFINNQSESTTLPKVIIKSEESLCLCSHVERIHMMASFTQQWQCLFVFFSSLNPCMWTSVTALLLNPGKIRQLSSLLHLLLRHHTLFFSLWATEHFNFALKLSVFIQKYYVDIKLHDFLLSVEYKKRCLARCSCCSSMQ